MAAGSVNWKKPETVAGKWSDDESLSGRTSDAANIVALRVFLGVQIAAIGHFRVRLSLSFKASLSAKFLLW